MHRGNKLNSRWNGITPSLPLELACSVPMCLLRGRNSSRLRDSRIAGGGYDSGEK
jgi:hypothetical protein